MKRLDRGLSCGNIEVYDNHAKFRCRDCTNFGHAPVDVLHSVENKGNKTSVIYVDFKNGRSKTNSFFDSFRGFPGWLVSPGLKLIHCSAPAALRQQRDGNGR